MRELSAILAIAYRDLLKFLRDVPRIVSSLIFPVLFIGVLGGSLQANLGVGAGYNLLVFTFTGVLAQTLFQSTASGVISLIEDRQNDFSQAVFVAPISRYSIVFGKILGETLVALPQGMAIVIFAMLIRVPIDLAQLGALAVVGLAACLFGGAFGVAVLSGVSNQRTANQVFPFIMLPQFFLAGIFAPIKVLPIYLEVLSRISPLRYAVDLMRGAFYAGRPEYAQVVLASPAFNLAVMAVLFVVFLAAGTWVFVRGERNR
jgi:ABC-2 type transport system permease protein